jgi:hypothetical protein
MRPSKYCIFKTGSIVHRMQQVLVFMVSYSWSSYSWFSSLVCGTVLLLRFTYLGILLPLPHTLPHSPSLFPVP